METATAALRPFAFDDALSHADRRKLLVARACSAGPLDLSDLRAASEDNDDTGGDDDDDDDDDDREPQLEAETPDDEELASSLQNAVRDDDDQQDDEDEDELKAQFYRQQQLEVFGDDIECFLVCGLQLQLPASRSVKMTTAQQQQQQQQQPEEEEAKAPEALTASMHEQIAGGAPRLRRQQQRRRRRSSAVLPDGVLHLWVYRARRLAFRQHFESMYERHGLHIRAYLSWRKQCLSRPFESRRNIGGNMTSPVWRGEHDHTPNLMRGHFSVPLGDPASPESLPANTELVIEIVCGILVVSAAKVSLLEFFQDRASRSSAEDDDDGGGDPVRGDSGIVSVGQQWYPLVGQDAGQLEMSIEFVPASAFDEEDEEGEEEDVEEDVEEDELTAEEDVSELGESSNNFDADAAALELAEPQEQEPPEPVDVEQQHRELERRTLTRKTRFECSDALATRESGQVLVSNNGKTTMYIPSQCRLPTSSPSNTSVVAYKAPPPSGTPPSPSRADNEGQMDEQLLELYLHGISSDGSEPSTLSRTSSLASHASQFSLEYSGFSERSEASMYSRKASTCATDVWSYNELIKDMESSLEAEAELRSQHDPAASGAIPKANGNLRHAAPTSDPHPTTAAIGVVPTKSALKKSKQRRTRASNNDDAGDDDELQTSSVRETTPKGVVLFDLESIPEQLRAGFERSVSEDEVQHKKKDPKKGRRRSLPINSLSLGRPPPAGRSFRPQHMAIDEHAHVKSEVEIQAEMAASRRRRSSLHSLADLHARSREELTQRRRRQQHQEQQQLAADRAREPDRGSVLKPQRRNSNTGSVVNVGGAVLGVGKFINIGNVPGVVRYVGPTDFASGTWIGVELCEKKGKNNGAVRGIKYFSCAEDHGIFVRADRLDIGA